MQEFYHDKLIKRSRKEHTCHICELPIPIGFSYMSETGNYANEFFSRCTCIPCFAIRSEYLELYDEREYDAFDLFGHVLTAFCKKSCPEDRECGNMRPLTCPKLRAHYEQTADLSSYASSGLNKQKGDHRDN